MTEQTPMTPKRLADARAALDEDMSQWGGEYGLELIEEVKRLRTRAALADAMIERVARDTAAKEPFTSRRRWEDLPDDERTYLRTNAHRALAADLTPQDNA